MQGSQRAAKAATIATRVPLIRCTRQARELQLPLRNARLIPQALVDADTADQDEASEMVLEEQQGRCRYVGDIPVAVTQYRPLYSAELTASGGFQERHSRDMARNGRRGSKQ